MGHHLMEPWEGRVVIRHPGQVTLGVTLEGHVGVGQEGESIRKPEASSQMVLIILSLVSSRSPV